MDELPTPITRSEKFLAKAAGEDVSLPEPITREEIYLNAIANNGGGGSSLPDVTSDDNGDVLTVVDGAWAKAAPSGGGALDFDTYAVELAPASTTNQFNLTLYNLKSGEVCGTSIASIETDGETGDYRIVLGDTTGWDAPAVLIYELRYRFDRFDVDSLEADYTAGLTFGFYV